MVILAVGLRCGSASAASHRAMGRRCLGVPSPTPERKNLVTFSCSFLFLLSCSCFDFFTRCLSLVFRRLCVYGAAQVGLRMCGMSADNYLLFSFICCSYCCSLFVFFLSAPGVSVEDAFLFLDFCNDCSGFLSSPRPSRPVFLRFLASMYVRRGAGGVKEVCGVPRVVLDG